MTKIGIECRSTESKSLCTSEQSVKHLNVFRLAVYNERGLSLFVVLSYWPALCFVMLLAPGWGPAGLRSRRVALFWHHLLCPTSDSPSPFSLSLSLSLLFSFTFLDTSWPCAPSAVKSALQHTLKHTHTHTHTHLPKSAAISLTVFCRH